VREWPKVMSSLQTLGWNEDFARAFEAFAREHVLPGRVALEAQHIYRVFTEQGELLAKTAGGLRHRAETALDYPAVGDWVALRLRPGEPRASIQHILPRRSRFSRKVAGDQTREQVVASNIDTVFLTMGLDGDYNVRRIERYLLTGWESGAAPVVLLTKADLCDDDAVAHAGLGELVAQALDLAQESRHHVRARKRGSGECGGVGWLVHRVALAQALGSRRPGVMRA